MERSVSAATAASTGTNAAQDLSSDFRSPVKMRSQRSKLSQKTAKSVRRDEAEAGTSSARMTEPREKVDTTSSQSTVSSSGTVSTGLEIYSDSDGSDGKRCCPSCCRRITVTTYPSHLITCLKKFSRNAAAADDETSSGGNYKKADPRNVCVVCERYIGHMNDQRREQHMNRCLDKANEVDRRVDDHSDVLPCPFCNIRPKCRMLHIKKCAAKAGVAAEKLLDTIHLLERQAREREEAGLPPSMPPPPSNVHGKRRAHGTRARRQNGTSEDNDSEEMDVAVAMSLSEQQEPIRVRPSDVGGRRKRNMHSGPPLLLLRSEEDRAAIISERIDKIVTEQSSGNEPSSVDWSRAPPHVSRFKENTSECLLWNLASLSDRMTSDPAVFYVESLRPFVTPCRVKPGDKMKRLSQVPGYLTQRTPSKPKTADVGPSTQEIAHILDAVENFDDGNTAETQSRFFSMGTEDAVEKASGKRDKPNDEDDVIIADTSDMSGREEQLLEEASANRHRKAAEMAEHFDQRLKDMQQEFSMTSDKLKAASQSKPTSSKRKLRFLTQPTIINPSNEASTAGHNFDLQASVTNYVSEDYEMRSLGSPDLFGDDEDDMFNEIDLDAIAKKNIEDSKATVVVGKEKSGCAEASSDASRNIRTSDETPNDSVQIIPSPVGRIISTSTPLQKSGGSPTKDASLKCRFSISPLKENQIQALLDQDTVVVPTKSVSFLEPSRDSENGAKRQRIGIGDSPKIDLEHVDGKCDVRDNLEAGDDVMPRNSMSYNDVWNSFQDDAGFYDLPPTPSFAAMAGPHSPEPRIVECDAPMTTTAPTYSPYASSSSGRSQEYLPNTDTPFTKDDSFIMEMDNERTDENRNEEPKKTKRTEKTDEEPSKKTKAAGKRKRTEKPVTPMPHYSMMVTPEIRKELAKIGVKKLPKTKAKKILKHVYEETHPLVPCSDNDMTTDEPEPVSSPKCSKKRKSDSKSAAESSRSTKVSESQPEMANKRPKKSKKPVEVESSFDELNEDVNNFMKSHLRWHEKIVQYEVIDVNVLREDLKSAGFKISLKSLKDHLDEQCVTYSDMQDK